MELADKLRKTRRGRIIGGSCSLVMFFGATLILLGVMFHLTTSVSSGQRYLAFLVVPVVAGLYGSAFAFPPGTRLRQTGKVGGAIFLPLTAVSGLLFPSLPAAVQAALLGVAAAIFLVLGVLCVPPLVRAVRGLEPHPRKR